MQKSTLLESIVSTLFQTNKRFLGAIRKKSGAVIGAAFLLAAISFSGQAYAETTYVWNGTSWDAAPPNYPNVVLSDDSIFNIQSDIPGSPTITSLSGSNDIVKTGNGTLYLNGNNRFSFTGNTSVTGGTLEINNEYAISTDFSIKVFGNGTAGSAVLKSQTYIEVGTSDYGSLSVSNGGQVIAAERFYLGFNSTGIGYAAVDGAGSQIQHLGTGSDNNVYIGYDGKGVLDLTNGGTLSSSRDIRIGANNGTGTVFVDSLSSITTDGEVRVAGSGSQAGYLSGTGSVTATGGILINPKGTLSAGDDTGEIGTLYLVGDTTFANGATLAVDYDNGEIDLIDIVGTATLNGTTNISVSSLNTAGISSTRTILTTTGGITGVPTGNLRLNGLDLTGSRATGNVILALGNGNNDLQITSLSIIGTNKNVTWTGSTDTDWEIAKQNWSDDDNSGAATTFLDGDAVTFATTADTTINILGTQKTVVEMKVANTDNLTINGNIIAEGTATTLTSNNSGKLIKSHAGTLTLNGFNDFRGGVEIAAGTLDGDIGQRTSLAFTGNGTYVAGVRDLTLTSLDGTSGTVEINWSDLTVESGSFGGIITGKAGLIKSGNDTLTLSGTNTYTGGTTVTAGTLDFAGKMTGTTLNVADGATVKFDGSKESTFSGNANFNSSGTLLVYGDADKNRPAMKGVEFGSVTGLSDGLLVGQGQFTQWYFDTAASAVLWRLLSNSDMSDARLGALLMHNRQAVWSATNERLNQHEPLTATTNYRAQCNNKTNNSVWGNYVGRSNKLQSSYNGFQNENWDIASNGVQTGLDLFNSRSGQFGVMFGYENQTSDLRNDQVKADDYYFGFYGARRFANGFDLRGFIGYGHQSYDLTRYGVSGPDIFRHTAGFDGDTFETTLELGRTLNFNRCFSIRPVIAIDFYNNDIAGVNEDGNVATAVNYSDTSLTQTFLRMGASANRDLWSRLSLTCSAYYSRQLASNGDKLRTGVFSQQTQIWNGLSGSDLGNSVVTLNAGTQYYLNRTRTCALFGNYYADLYTDRAGSPAQHTAMAGLQWRF